MPIPYLFLLNTCPNETVAQQLAHVLVQNELVACVNIIPQIRSVFKWQGQITEENEVLLLMKTRQECYTEIEALLQKQHPYQVPELIALPIETGLAQYLQWIDETVKKA